MAAAAVGMSVVVGTVVLASPPAEFGPTEWVSIVASAAIAAGLSAYRSPSRGALAGAVCLAAALLGLKQPTLAQSISWVSVLGFAFAVGGGLWASALGLAIAALGIGVAAWADGLLVSSIALSAAVMAWGSAATLERAGPMLAAPLSRVSSRVPFLATFLGLVAAVIVLFALLFNFLHLRSPASFVDSPGGSGALSLEFHDFLYMSACVLTTVGSPFYPADAAAQALIVVELVLSVGLLMVYLSLLLHTLMKD